MLNTGIYQIKNMKNGKIYIGSTNNFAKRQKQHFHELKTGRHINKALQHDFKTHGDDNFQWKIVEYTWNSNRLQREQAWIDKYKKSKILYNTGVANANPKTIKNEFAKIISILWRMIKDIWL